MKAYTDLEQSRKLAEILPIESADMCLTFVNNIWNPVWGKADDIYQLQKDCYEPDYTKDEYVDFDEFEPKVVPCWSLAALLDVYPMVVGKDMDMYCCWQNSKHLCSRHYDNPIDACVEMILKLNELKIL